MSNFSMRYYLDIINEHNELVEYVEAGKSMIYSLLKMSPQAHRIIMSGQDIKTNDEGIKADLDASGLDTRQGRDPSGPHANKGNQHVFLGPITGKDTTKHQATINLVKTTQAQAVAKQIIATIKETKTSNGVWVVTTATPFDEASYRTFDNIKPQMIRAGIQVFDRLPDKRLIVVGITGSTGREDVFQVMGSDRETFGPANGAKIIKGKNGIERIGKGYLIAKPDLTNPNKPAEVKPASFEEIMQAHNEWAKISVHPFDSVSPEGLSRFLNDPKTVEFLTNLKGSKDKIETWHLAQLRVPKDQ
jgi:hypothetical protein